MKKGLIGKKLGMTQVYTDKGVLVPVTAIELGPCPVIDVRTVAKNNYSALQLCFGYKKAKNVSKAVIGNLKKAGQDANPPAIIREIRLARVRFMPCTVKSCSGRASSTAFRLPKLSSSRATSPAVSFVPFA